MLRLNDEIEWRWCQKYETRTCMRTKTLAPIDLCGTKTRNHQIKNSLRLSLLSPYIIRITSLSRLKCVNIRAGNVPFTQLPRAKTALKKAHKAKRRSKFKSSWIFDNFLKNVRLSRRVLKCLFWNNISWFSAAFNWQLQMEVQKRKQCEFSIIARK